MVSPPSHPGLSTVSTIFSTLFSTNGSIDTTDRFWISARCKRVRTMERHRLRVGALAWSSSMLSLGSRDKSILQRDPRAQDDFVSKLNGNKLEVCGLKWLYDTRELASGGNDNRHTTAVKEIAWSPHVHGLLASGEDTDNTMPSIYIRTVTFQFKDFHECCYT
ncbi:FIZZY-related 2-like protein [Tanacetum coccineum]